MTCASCSSEVPEGAKFCPECGTATLPTTDEERRIVTVLFADLVGFTSLAEYLDPEQVKRLVDGVFARLVADVESYGGSVDKVLGDGIIALFGAPVAHEDDAERAVRAGLAMQGTMRRFRLEQSTAVPVEMRVGINTGEVLVGTLAGTDYTAMGDVVNTASRIQELAAAGSVLVGDATRELCADAVQFRAHEPLHLRGREQESTVWQAVGLAPVGVRRWDSDVAFVGRRAELGMLSSLLDVVVTGRSAIVSIVGEAGIGKSRLVHEAVAPLLAEYQDATLLEGACAPYGENNVWWPVAGDALCRLGLDRDLAVEESRDAVRDKLGSLPDVEWGPDDLGRAVEVVLHILGQPSALDDLGAAASRDAVFAAVIGAFRRSATTAPLVVWVDDVQWAAPLLLDMLELVARQLAMLPVLVITTYRPSEEGAKEWPPPAEPALSLHLPLSPLDEAESLTLVGNVAGPRVPGSAARRLFLRSGGNPLFLIELAKLAGAAEDPNDQTKLPGTLRALIAARLDQLSLSERQVLDNASILGNEGRYESLKEFAAEMNQTFDAADLASLEAGGLLLVDAPRWRFRSDVVREVAYHTLTKQARAQRHAGVAAYMSVHESGQVDRRAHHAASAAELSRELGPVTGVPATIRADALQLLHQAGERWYRQGGHLRGLKVVERALALVDDEIDEYRQLLLIHIEGLVETRQLSQAQAELVELVELAEAADDRVVRAEVYRLRGTIDQMTGDLVAARRELGHAVSEFRELGDDAHLAEALLARGFAEIFGGSLTEAEWFLGEADERFAAIGDRRGLAWVQQHQAWVSFLAGDHAAAEARLDGAIAAFTILGDRAGRAWAIGLLAYVYHFARRHDEADQLASEALAEARQWGDEWGAAMMLNLQASIRLWRADFEQARHLADRALTGFRRIDDRFGIIQSLGTLTRSLVAGGKMTEADRSVEEVLVLADSFGELAYPVIAAAGTSMHLGQGERAAELAAEAVARLDTTGANVDEGRVVMAFGHLLADDADRALAALLDVDVDGSPFALAARATARAITGDRDGARSDAEAVLDLEGVSYWDRLVADVAGTAAAHSHGADEARGKLLQEADAVDDAVLSPYARWVALRLGGDTAHDVPRGGWHQIAERLVEVAGA